MVAGRGRDGACPPGRRLSRSRAENHRRATGKYARDLEALVDHGLKPEMATAQFSRPGASPHGGYYFSDPMPKLLLFAFPAKYGRTGRNTFIIDQSGVLNESKVICRRLAALTASTRNIIVTVVSNDSTI